MTVALDAAGTALGNNAQTSFSSAALITVGSGSNRGLVLLICWSGASAPTNISMTWGGTAMSLIGMVTAGSSTCAAYGLLNPASGAQTLAGSWTGSADYLLVPISFTGALSFHGTSNTASSSTASLSVPSNTGDMVCGVVGDALHGVTSITATSLYDTGQTNVNSAADYLTASSPTTAISAPLGGSSVWTAFGVDISQYPNVLIGDSGLDLGLNALDTLCDAIYVCGASPTSYANATSGSNSLGSQNLGAGNVFSLSGNQVTSVAISNGTISTSGTVAYWAAVDTVNSRLYASGPLSGGVSVTAGQLFNLASFSITLPNS